jgi:hypothetical protein
MYMKTHTHTQHTHTYTQHKYILHIHKHTCIIHCTQNVCGKRSPGFQPYASPAAYTSTSRPHTLLL